MGGERSGDEWNCTEGHGEEGIEGEGWVVYPR
jgi:hypothetical protein